MTVKIMHIMYVLILCCYQPHHHSRMCVVVLRMAAGDAVREGEALKLLFNQTHSPWGASVCPGVATSATLPPEQLTGGHERLQ